MFTLLWPVNLFTLELDLVSEQAALPENRENKLLYGKHVIDKTNSMA